MTWIRYWFFCLLFSVMTVFAPPALAQHRPQQPAARQSPCVVLRQFPADVAAADDLLTEGERDAQQHNDFDCFARLANEHLARGHVARARELLDRARLRDDVVPQTRCLRGMTDLAVIAERAAVSVSQNGGLPVVCPGLHERVRALTIACIERGMTDRGAGLGALRLLTDTARLCRDTDNVLGATAGVLSLAFRATGTARPAELQCLRDEARADGLTTCTDLAAFRELTSSNGSFSDEELSSLSARARAALDAFEDATGAIAPSAPGALLTAVALLVADAHLAAHRPHASGIVYDDLERLSREGLITEPLVLRAASDLPLLHPAMASGRSAFRHRIERLRARIGEARTPESTLVQLLLGVAGTDPTFEGDTNPFLRVIREAVTSPDFCSIPFARYEAVVREAAEEGLSWTVRHGGDRPSAYMERGLLDATLHSLDGGVCPRDAITLNL